MCLESGMCMFDDDDNDDDDDDDTLVVLRIVASLCKCSCGGWS